MPKINLESAWAYVTPEKTIDYPAGTHDVFQYIADKAEADGVIKANEDGDGTATARKASTAGKTKK